ncbi:heparinase ii iii family protein [Moniliophthora roreri MCA 2997]|uniref:Heparinase ii iii family protein n=1 Tax=Moniliophthora roreri (strain MCA 2997) TaxID=1381753 RepID=V2XGS5_MONRO|nr:heparinase ii iii family protein [Moniliophthora roreri MCA 2997]
MVPHYSTIDQNTSDSPYQNSSHEPTGFISPETPQKKRTSPWLKWALTKDRSYVDLAWREISNAFSSNFGPETDQWNNGHFLDTAELSAAFRIEYDWLYNALSDDQKGQMRDALIKYGLGPGAMAYTDASVNYAWWRNGVKDN